MFITCTIEEGLIVVLEDVVFKQSENFQLLYSRMMNRGTYLFLNSFVYPLRTSLSKEQNIHLISFSDSHCPGISKALSRTVTSGNAAG